LLSHHLNNNKQQSFSIKWYGGTLEDKKWVMPYRWDFETFFFLKTFFFFYFFWQDVSTSNFPSPLPPLTILYYIYIYTYYINGIVDIKWTKEGTSLVYSMYHFKKKKSRIKI
jgi:hypothetical protein